jgi:hypothetical protein
MERSSKKGRILCIIHHKCDERRKKRKGKKRNQRRRKIVENRIKFMVKLFMEYKKKIKFLSMGVLRQKEIDFLIS